jgi:hypothetical protein
MQYGRLNNTRDNFTLDTKQQVSKMKQLILSLFNDCLLVCIVYIMLHWKTGNYELQRIWKDVMVYLRNNLIICLED